MIVLNEWITVTPDTLPRMGEEVLIAVKSGNTYFTHKASYGLFMGPEEHFKYYETDLHYSKVAAYMVLPDYVPNEVDTELG